MADVIKNGKYFTDFSDLSELSLEDILLLCDGSKIGKTTLEKLKAIVTLGLPTDLEDIIPDGAGAHNAIYRGKYLGASVTDEMYANIKDGTFKGIFVGDYVTIGGVNYRFAGFDYYLHCGDTETTDHHAVMVPDTCLYNAQMNTSNTTAGAYVGSAMYTTNLATAKSTIKAAFGSHVLKHRIHIQNAVSNGRPSGGTWYDSEVDLMCEEMVYGTHIFAPVSDGTNVPNNYKVEKSQLPLFALDHSRICNRVSWWLRDVVTGALFAHVYTYGGATYAYASTSLGVRPAFCIS